MCEFRHILPLNCDDSQSAFRKEFVFMHSIACYFGFKCRPKIKAQPFNLSLLLKQFACEDEKRRNYLHKKSEANRQEDRHFA